MSFATIPDRVPVEVIQALTNAALRVYLERHGWELHDEWTHRSGASVVAFRERTSRSAFAIVTTSPTTGCA